MVQDHQGFTTVKPRPPPPITLDKLSNLTEILDYLEVLQLTPANITTTKAGINLFMSSINDFRHATEMLKEKEQSFHTYRLPDDKTLKVVLRGIPVGLTTDRVVTALKDPNFPVISAKRMTKGPERTTMPLVLVSLTKSEEGKHLFNITKLLFITISAEALKPNNLKSQCHRCQRFGHASSSCNIPFRCVKCSGPHNSRDCAKPHEVTPTCCNCRRPHTANYRGCPAFPPPKPSKLTDPPRRNPPTHKPPLVTSTLKAPPTTTTHTSYVRAVSPRSAPAPTKNITNVSPRKEQPTAAPARADSDYPALPPVITWAPSRRPAAQRTPSLSQETPKDTAPTPQEPSAELAIHVSLPTEGNTPSMMESIIKLLKAADLTKLTAFVTVTIPHILSNSGGDRFSKALAALPELLAIFK